MNEDCIPIAAVINEILWSYVQHGMEPADDIQTLSVNVNSDSKGSGCLHDTSMLTNWDEEDKWAIIILCMVIVPPIPSGKWFIVIVCTKLYNSGYLC